MYSVQRKFIFVLICITSEIPTRQSNLFILFILGQLMLQLVVGISEDV